MAQIEDFTAVSGVTGSKSSIGATALQLTATSTHLYNGVEIKADAANSTGIVYVGFSSAITAAAADGTTGFQLVAGESRFFEIDDPSKIYVIGSTTGLKVWFKGT